MPVKVCSGTGQCLASDIVAGIDYCLNLTLSGVNVSAINGAFGDGGAYNSTDCPTGIDAALAAAWDGGVVNVFAAGNDGIDGATYPACSPYSLSVGAVDKNGVLAGFSNRGPLVEVYAPGVTVNSTLPGGAGVRSGTSMATGFVSGTTALLSDYSKMTGTQTDARLTEAAIINASSNLTGIGALDVTGAIIKLNELNQANWTLTPKNNSENTTWNWTLNTTFQTTEDSESASLFEWRMFGRYLNHTAWDGTTFYKIPTLNTANFSSTVQIYSSPAIANGYLYIGSRSSRVYQRNASNISQSIASYLTTNEIQSSPAVANGYVYIGNLDGKIYQLNSTNVSQKFENYTTGGAIYSSAAVANGYLYIGSDNGMIYQLNATNISQKIENYTTGGAIGFSSPAVANGYVYIGSSDNSAYQLNATNVSQKFENYTTGDDIRASPAVSNGYLYIGSLDNKVYQLNASNISLKVENFTTANDVYSSPAIANGYLYVAGYAFSPIYQLNATNISQKNRTIRFRKNRILSSNSKRVPIRRRS